ncbi:NADP-dependent oxidoreductase [Subtercola vilae]|uniref:NADP-dependent oxidoreductase n=1 Tax=Subtercola vilae TaxID=2056433 RepID=A0A4T2C106_9MICO|nr:NADP-dependent oxidoreductase [Subtercola vilae]TIH35648.1 NADP-dependent oxidoreductase [Subtercola vilae]
MTDETPTASSTPSISDSAIAASAAPAVPSTARAVQLDNYGGVDVLHISPVVVARPAAGEVLVQVRAAGINPGEAAIRQGYLDQMFPATFPSGEGTDFAGVVVAVGTGVDAFAVGDEVMGWSEKRSSQAEYVTVPEHQLIPKPAELSWEVAGSLFVAGVTAFAAVRAVSLAGGDTVVVSAAAGGVGSLAVQLAKLKGAAVIGIASEANHGWLEARGVTPVAYGDGLADRIRALAPGGIDAFIDTYGPEYLDLAVELGIAVDRIDTIIAFEAAGRIGAKAEGSSAASTTDALGEIARLVAAGDVLVEIAATYPLDEVRAAFVELEKHHTRGKIVLIP